MQACPLLARKVSKVCLSRPSEPGGRIQEVQTGPFVRPTRVSLQLSSEARRAETPGSKKVQTGPFVRHTWVLLQLSSEARRAKTPGMYMQSLCEEPDVEARPLMVQKPIFQLLQSKLETIDCNTVPITKSQNKASCWKDSESSTQSFVGRISNRAERASRRYFSI